MTWKILLDFKVSKINVGVGEEVTFTPTTPVMDIPADTVRQSTWTFGDDSASNITTPNPSIPTVKHTYTEPGEYDVSLGILCVSGMHSVIVRYATISVSRTVFASFEAGHRRGLVPFSPVFDASSSMSKVGTIVSYEWWFGDGTTGVGVAPDKTYEKRGVYSVKLKVTDDAGNTDEVILSAYIYAENNLLYSGDEGVSMEFSFAPLMYTWGVSSLPSLRSQVFNKMYIGAKPLITKYDHYFQGFIPVYKDSDVLGDIHQPSLTHWNLSSGMKIVKNSKSYTGYVLEKTHDANFPLDRRFAELVFDRPSYSIYRGAYRMFMRIGSSVKHPPRYVYFSAGVSSGVSTGVDSWHSNFVTDALNPEYTTVIDLGSVVLGGKYGVKETIQINWKSDYLSVGEKIYIYDVVLIPQDTWYTEIEFEADNFFRYSEGEELLIGSITPDGNLESRIYNTHGLTGEARSDYDVIAIPGTIPGMPLSLVGADTRFTVFTVRHWRGGWNEYPEIPVTHSHFNYIYELSAAKKVNRYFSSRGKN
jgi:PKD repeat protein